MNYTFVKNETACNKNLFSCGVAMNHSCCKCLYSKRQRCGYKALNT